MWGHAKISQTYYLLYVQHTLIDHILFVGYCFWEVHWYTKQAFNRLLVWALVTTWLGPNTIMNFTHHRLKYAWQKHRGGNLHHGIVSSEREFFETQCNDNLNKKKHTISSWSPQLPKPHSQWQFVSSWQFFVWFRTIALCMQPGKEQDVKWPSLSCSFCWHSSACSSNSKVSWTHLLYLGSKIACSRGTSW